MPEVLVEFEPALTEEMGRRYVARVYGREAEDGLWEGWIEFEPRDGGPVLRTPRETGQPNRADLEYWATGLTPTYLEGALERARDPRPARPPVGPATPRADAAPAPRPGVERASAPRAAGPRPVLDPFAVYAQGEDVLRKELGALDEGHLRNILRAHALVDGSEVDVQALHRSALAELVVASVRKRAG